MKYPTRAQAEALLLWAVGRNPGPWEAHSRCAARAAEAIAAAAGIDRDLAWCAGLLHDVGRYEGVTGLRHAVAGRELLAEKGYPDLGRICLTHSFPSPDLGQYIGHRDAGEAGEAMIREALLQVDELDRLIQLCDAICMAEGVVLMEVRLVDVALRHGLPGGVVGKWRAFFDIKRDFERRIGRSIYALFPEVASLSVR
ncbi:MAG: HD domain-containing protein [Clostridiales bacterium]|nr:HD domain-containing protein [Clostridiales bacterium]